MQIIGDNAQYQYSQQEDLKKTTHYIYLCDTSQFLKDKGLTYYSTLKGFIAYYFDDPRRIHNLVLIKLGKNNYVEMRTCEFITHLILWKANVVFNEPITTNDIYNVRSSDPSSLHINTIMDIIVKRLVEKEGEVTDAICEVIYKIKDEFSELLHGYSGICCNTVSIYDIIQFKNRNKEFNSLINTTLDETKSIKELENEIKDCEARLVKVIKEDPYNCFNPYLRSKRINSGQLTKVLVAVGTRPDIDKTILPKPIKRGYIHGLQTASEYFMETLTARDAMLTKVDNVPLSGLLSREVNRLTSSSIYINYDVVDCGTKHTLKYEVKNKDYLDMIIGKYYYDDANKLHAVTGNEQFLIGKTIRLRSFITCALDKGVCQTCVGKISNRLTGTRLGALPSIKTINPLSNMAMAGKHNTSTKSIEIINEALLKYFYHDGVDFYINQEYAEQRNIYIVINQDDVEELLYSSNFDVDDDTIDTRIQLSYVAIRDKGVDYVLENEGMRIALSEEIISQKNLFLDDSDDPDYVLIPINKIDPSSPIFSVILDTEEISKYLNSFINTIDRKTVSRFQTYDNLIEEMNRIVYEAGFKNEIIHFESIINCMIRSVDDITVRPDFTEDKVDYQILRISNAIEKKDLYTTLSFQGLRRLFKDITIRKRMGTSLYDPFFRISPLF
jgi:hypothetical protein